MEVIIKNNVYAMTQKHKDAMMDIAKKYSSNCSIYALEKDYIIELTNKSYSAKSSLKRAVKQFESKGFKVYYKE